VLASAVVRGRKNPLFLGFASRLRRARKAEGLTRFGVTTMTTAKDRELVASLEAGHRIPRLDTVEKLAFALGVSPAFLAYGLDGAPDSSCDTLRALGVAARLRMTRIDQGLSVLAVATAAGISHTAVGNIERGTVPGLDTTEALATALGVSPGWLAYGIGPMESPRRRAVRAAQAQPSASTS